MSTISMACGVVDTEQAQEAFDLKEQVLTIQVEEIDPLIDQIFDLDRQIEPIEREIEDFERQREKIYDQGRDLGNEFEREMKDRFSMVFEGEEQAHRAFEDALEGEWIALEKKRKKIEQSMNFERGTDIKMEMDDQSQAMYGAFEEEKYAKEQEIRADTMEVS